MGPSASARGRQLRCHHHAAPQFGRYTVVGRAPQVIDDVSCELILPQCCEVWIGRVPLGAPLAPYRLALGCLSSILGTTSKFHVRERGRISQPPTPEVSLPSH